MNKKTPLIISALALITLFVIYLRNKAAKFIGYVTYEIASFKLHSVTLSTVLCKVGIAINNPSDTSVKVQNYKVEVYLKGQDGKRSLLAASPANQLSIPAKQKITLNTDLSISTIQAAKLIKNLTQIILGGKISELIQRLQEEMKAQTVVVIKATVMDNFIEKELRW
jgi:hypothetical protein